MIFPAREDPKMTFLKVGLLGLGALVLVVGVAYVIAAGRFRTIADDLAAQVKAGPPTTEADLPEVLRARAVFNGAGRDGPYRAARLVQDAEFRRTPEATWGPMPAVQHMGLGQAGFVWDARAPGPVLPSFTVIDAYVGGRGLLRANLFGAIPVAHARGGVVDRAEAMRYLAELPWAPDAVLGNPDITWTVLEDDQIEAALETPSGRVAVRFTLDAEGDFAEMVAERPDTRADGTEFTREWRGRYADYGWVGGRRIPLAGEVGYVEDGTYWGYWRGRITALELLP
jgi:hypothetical protein